MLLVQKWPFCQLYFLGYIGQENVFYDILERKNVCLGYKNKKFKKSKNWHFSKGVNPWFGYKNGHFSIFFFRQYSPEKCLLRYSRAEKLLSRLSKQEVQKVKKLTFLTFLVLVQKWPFFHFFFLSGNIGQENVF